MGMIEDVERAHLRTDIPDFKAGDTVRVNVKIKEGDKERIQAFEGWCSGGVGALPRHPLR